MKLIFDLGTTNIKLNLYNDQNELVDQKEFSNQKVYFYQNYRFNPKKLLEFFQKTLQKYLQKYRTNFEIGISSAMHTLIFLDEFNEPIIPGFSLLDQTKKLSIKKVQDFHDKNGLVNGYFLPIFKIKKYLTAKLRTKLSLITTLKGYLLLHLTQQNYLEISDAVGLGLVNYHSKSYDWEILKYLNLDIKVFPEILTKVTKFSLFKNNKEVSLFLGTSDGAASAYFVNAIYQNALSLSVGTTFGIRKLINYQEILTDPNFYLFPVDDENYVWGISSSNGANNLEYVLKQRNLDFNYFQQLSPIKQNNLYEQPILFFQERGFNDRKISQIDDYEDTEKLVKTLIYQLACRIKQATLFLNKNNSIPPKIICSGGIFKSDYIRTFFQMFFDNELIFDHDNLSIAGVLHLMTQYKE